MIDKILFVCLGNICRSPTAEGVFADKVKGIGLDGRFAQDSAGVMGHWHAGKAPDARAQAYAIKQGVDLSTLRARAVNKNDFYDQDYIFAMDTQNLADLEQMKPKDATAKLSLFLDWLPGHEGESVPDPYTGDEKDFQHVYELIADTSDAIISALNDPKH